VQNGIIPDALNSIERRVPLHPDFLLIVMKFMATMHLNDESRKVLGKSKAIENLLAKALDPRVFKLIG